MQNRKNMKIIFYFIVLIVIVSSTFCKYSENIDEIITLTRVMEIDGNLEQNNYFTPANILVDSEGKIFILDPICQQIIVFNNNGEYLYEFGRIGEGPGEFNQLFYNFDIDDNDNIYIINRPNMIEVFNNDGEYLYRISPDVEHIFDIAVYNMNEIFINAGVITSQRDCCCIIKINRNGEVINEYGYVDVDTGNMPPWKKYSVQSCVIDVDNDGNVYYTSIIDYKIFKYDINGYLIYAVEGSAPFEALWIREGPYGNRTVTPVVWDLYIDQNKIYVLWAQEGDERGYRVDVFNKVTGDILGYFYTQTPSEQRNVFIKVTNCSDFYTASFDEAIVYKFEMNLRER